LKTLTQQINKITGSIWLFIEYKGTTNLDGKMRRAAHKKEDGSGFAIGSGTRDMSFTFHRKPALKKAISRLNKRFGKNVKLKIEAQPTDMD
jgi:hypothetical protein